jgi:hypothetical protein
MKSGVVGRLAALACPVVVLGAACSSGPSVDTGPLGDGGTRGSICMPVRSGGVVSWGITILRNSGQSNAVIERVSLLGARKLRLVASYVVPITGLRDYGAWEGYPPAPPQPGVIWSKHTLARGAVIPPQIGQRHSNLVTVLKPTGRVGKARAIDVLYREDGTQSRLVTHTRFVILAGVKSCP